MTESTARKYTVSLPKGQGILEETLVLLRVWRPGMSSKGLADLAVAEGLLSKATARRTRDIVLVQFGPRFLDPGNGPPAKWLRGLVDEGATTRQLRQIFLIHACRANDVLHDFIRHVYWPAYSAGASELSSEQAMEFLQRAVDQGIIAPPWSEKMRVRVAQSIMGCLTDFGLTGDRRGRIRELLPFHVTPLTTLYLAHEIHFNGRSDDAILDHDDWGLFGLEPIDVRYQLERVANGHFTLQFAGDLLRITWQCDSMEEALRGIAAAEL